MKDYWAVSIIVTILIISVVLSQDAEATTVIIGFEDLICCPSTYSEDGFTISSTGFGLFGGGFQGPIMFPSSITNVMTLTQDGGGAFDLDSIDIRELGFLTPSQTVVFQCNQAPGGSVTQSITTDGFGGFETFSFPTFVNCTSVVWDQVNPNAVVVYDNFVLDNVPTLPPVVWTGAGDGTSWSDPANWLDGVKPTCDGELILILLGTTVHLDEDCVGFFSLVISKFITFIIDDGFTLTHEGGLGPGTITNSGTINNFGTLENFGTFFNINTGTVNNFGNIVNLGSIENFGTINNFCGSTFINESVDTIRNFGTITGVNLLSGEPVVDLGGTTTTISCGGGDKHEPPTIGQSTYGFQVVTCGVAFDSKCFTITAPFHEEFKLYEMMSGTHTISITIYCANGVNTCNYAAIGIMPYSESMANTTWKIELYKDFEGNLTTVTTDPEGFLGTVTVTTQIIDDKFWIVSFTVDFKNKDTGPMMFGVQARDNYNAVRNWYLNEGVEFIDSDAYPSIETAFEDSLEINSLCLNEDPTYRYSCAFAENRERAIQTAEETLRQIMNGEYTYK